MLSSLKQAISRRHPSAFLLAAQLLLLVLFAWFEGSYPQQALLSIASIPVLALVIWVITRSPAVNWIAWVLAIPALGIGLLAARTGDPGTVVWSSLLLAVLYFYTAGSQIAYMLGDTEVTTDELFAAGATFTLLAWGFADLYQACQTWIPGSFSGGTYLGTQRTFLELLSLSFTNLTATGLSDVLPVTPPARVLVMLEQFAGIGYVAVVVSRLIGMTLARRSHKKLLH